MAEDYSIVTNTYTEGYENSLKPSVDENIGLFSPTDTPFLAGMSSKKGRQRKEEWLEDELDPVGENAHVEAFDAVSEEGRAPERSDNYMQILEKHFSISGTASAVDMYGRKSDLNRQRGLATKSLARDLEFAFLNGVLAQGSKTTPRKMKGAFEFVDKTGGAYLNFGGAGADTNQITEQVLLDCLQGVWDQGVEPNTVMCPMIQKRKISQFTQNGRLTITQNADSKKVTMSVSVIVTDMGTVAVIANRFIQPTDDEGALEELGTAEAYDRILCYRRDVFTRRVLRPVKEFELAKTGDSEKYFLCTEVTLQCSTQKGVGSIELLSRAEAA
ncbi:MAG: DUF5309 domain-containing protein [Betaproteobacteria bacterium]|nr:DUF5309 domain-containing protein [Betaproteobacteria bacterium]